MAVTRWHRTVCISGLTGVVVLPEAVESKIVGRVNDRGGILTPTICVLLIPCTLHDQRWRIRAGGIPGKNVEVNRWVVLRPARRTVGAGRVVNDSQVSILIHGRTGHEVEQGVVWILQIRRP